MVAGGDEILATDLDFAPIIARKTVDEDAPLSSAATQNDDELFISVKANSVYIVQALIRFTAASNTPDLRLTWAGPSGSTISHVAWGAPVASTSINDVIDTTAFTGDHVRGASTQQRSVLCFVDVATGVTAGTLQFKFGQSTSSADKVTVKAGSHIIGWKVS